MNHGKELKAEEIDEVLQRGEYAVLAITDGNEPYSLPLSYGLDKEIRTLYFLTEKEGMKLDFLKSNPYVCGTVIVRSSGADSTHAAYRSVIFRGVMEVIHKPVEQKKARLLLEMGSKFYPDEKKMTNPMIMKLELEDLDGRSSY